MKDLTELQAELRRLSAELDHLNRQVEDLKPKDQAYDISANYAAIQELARREPIENPSLAGLDGSKQTRYLRLLCTAAALDGEISIEQLLYLCRLAEGTGYIVEPGQLTAMAYQTEYLDWQAAALDLKKAALPLILDMIVVIHLAGRTPRQWLEFTAGLAALLECHDEDLTVCAQLASALLEQDFEAFKCIQAKRSYSNLGYAVPKVWLEKTRVKCGSYRMSYHERAKVR